MWWIFLIIAACALITTKHGLYRANEFSYKIASFAALLIICAEVGFWKGLRLAPSFFQPWFLGHVTLGLLGLLTSWLLGDVGIGTRHYIGAAMAFVAGVLLVS